MAKMVECTCRWSGKRFHYGAAAVARGRGIFCTRPCATAYGRKKRWEAEAKTVFERYEDHVVRRGDDECWDWSAFKHQGYGRLKAEGSEAAVGAHRISYLKHVGPIPVGQCVLHKCDNRACTNPKHLFLGDVYENNADRNAKGRQARGERAGGTSFTDAQVSEVKRVAVVSDTAARLLGKHLGMSSNMLSRILTGRNWRHVL